MAVILAPAPRHPLLHPPVIGVRCQHIDTEFTDCGVVPGTGGGLVSYMKTQTNRLFRILLALLLALSPVNAVFSMELDHCDSQMMTMPAPDTTTNHHDSAKPHKTSHSFCPHCANDDCCCDSGSCSCVIAHVFYLPALQHPMLNRFHLESCLPALYEHPTHPTIYPLLRPPIA